MASYGRPHRRQFFYGVLAALVVVATRIAVPWPIKAVLHNWSAHSSGRKPVDSFLGEDIWAQGLVLGLIFFGLIVGHGLADMLERLCFARYSIATVRDLRASAFRAAMNAEPVEEKAGSGDLIARLVGDTARIKAGLKGFFIHVATNATFMLFAIGALVVIDPTMGLIMATGGLAIVALTYWGAARMYADASGFRAKEGKIAETIHRSLHDDPSEAQFAKVNAASGRQEASLTRTQGLTTWIAYCIYGVAVLLAFWSGVGWVSSGRVSRGEMVVFVLYALMLRGPVVQLVRQGARTGKILACIDRLEATLGDSRGDSSPGVPFEPLRRALNVDQIKVRTSKAKGKRRRLGPVSLRIPAGQHLAIIGPPGSGKTTLMRALIGLEKLRQGRVLWDSREAATRPLFAGPHSVVGYLNDKPAWRRTSMRTLLGLAADGPTPAQAELLKQLGVDRLIARLREGYDARLGSHELSAGEARLISLAKVLLAGPSVCLLDAPVHHFKHSARERVIEAALAAGVGRTVVITLGEPVALHRFDRVVELKKGRIVFDGPPSDWALRRQAGAGDPSQATQTQVQP